ncbi:MAG: AraC family transcriptional regulator [Planctomycetota bacterium]
MLLTVPPFRPWVIGEQSNSPCFADALGASAWAIGLASSSQVTPDGVLSAGGTDGGFRADGFDLACDRDPLWREAIDTGVACQRANARDPLGSEGEEVLVACWPASSGPGLARRYWYTVLKRPRDAWTETQQRQAVLTLRRIQSAWDEVSENGLSRWLLGTDGRVLHSDAQTQADWPSDRDPAPGWATQIHDVVGQRWEATADRRVYDFVLAHEGAVSCPDTDPFFKDQAETNGTTGPVRAPADWVRVHHLPTVGGLGGGDYVETRPVDTNDSPPVGLVKDARVGRALGYMFDEYPRSPGLKDVAAVVESSPFHFHRLFRKTVGISPKHYVLRTQLQMAKWRLRTAPLPVGDIAAEVGFSSHGHFTATFHRIVGESPTDYRDRHAPEALGYGSARHDP